MRFSGTRLFDALDADSGLWGPLAVSSTTLFVSSMMSLYACQMFNLDQFYDYCLTIHDEVQLFINRVDEKTSVSSLFQIRYVWKTKFTLANTLFVSARYPAFLTAILVLFPVRFLEILQFYSHAYLPSKDRVFRDDERLENL